MAARQFECAVVSATYTLARSLKMPTMRSVYPVDNQDLAAECGPSATDVRHRASGLFSAALPGRVRGGASARVLSALPHNITTGRDDNGDAVSNDRPAGVTRNTGRGRAQTDVSVRVSRWIGFGARGGNGAAPGSQARRRGDDANAIPAFGGGGDPAKRSNIELYSQAFNAFNRTMPWRSVR